MLSIIILENDADIAEIAQSIRAAREWRSFNGTCELIVVGQMKQGASSDEIYVSTEGKSGAEALVTAISSARGERIIILDAKHGSERANVSQILGALSRETDGLSYVGVESDGEYVELPQLDTSRIASIVSGYDLWPVSGMSVERKAATSLAPLESERAQAFLARLIVKLVCQNEIVRHSGFTARRPALDTIAMHSLTLDERSACLAMAMEISNIEDMFPNHPWQTHGEESAAASYHTLAAIFIRLGSLEPAQSCLQLSEGLEASPRALALKGLLALRRGEILGAVANMVSSLQQYEERKSSDSSHYLHFMPKDLELINSQLNSGLAALNRRENSLAFSHFAEAVFNFDPFYSQLGINAVDVVGATH